MSSMSILAQHMLRDDLVVDDKTRIKDHQFGEGWKISLK